MKDDTLTQITDLTDTLDGDLVRRAKLIAQAYQQGATLREIAEATALNHETVRTIIRGQGVELRPRGRSGAHVPTSTPRVIGRPQA